MRKRDTALILAALAAALIFGGAILRESALPTASWGLHFPGDGLPPTGSAGRDILGQYDAVYLGDTTQPVIYLTFDAGYENGATEKILDTLKEKQVSAAFFLVGNYLQRNADLVRRMVSEGHIVGNHTMNHPDMASITDPEAFARELQGLEDLYREVTGQELPKYYRPPQGIYSRENLQLAKDLGYRTVFWSLAYVDWNNDAQPSREYALEKLIPRTHKGAIVLLHSTSSTNGEILGELIDTWTEMGYRFGTLDELFPG